MFEIKKEGIYMSDNTGQVYFMSKEELKKNNNIDIIPVSIDPNSYMLSGYEKGFNHIKIYKRAMKAIAKKHKLKINPNV